MAYILLGLLGLIWGSQFLFNAWALVDFSPAMIAMCRIFLGALSLTLVYVFFSRKEKAHKFSIREKTILFIIAFFEATLPFCLIPLGQQQVDSGVTAILLASIPIFVIVFSALLLPTAAITFRNVLSVVLGFLGLLVLFFPGLKASHFLSQISGQLLILSGSASFAFSLVLMKRYVAGHHPLQTVCYILWYAFLQMVPLVWFLHEAGSFKIQIFPMLGILCLGVFCTGIAYFLYFRLISKYGVIFTSMTNYVVPLVGVFLGVIILGESPRPTDAIALVMIFGAIGLYREPS